MTYTFKTQSGNVYTICPSPRGYDVSFNDAPMGSAMTQTGAHCLICRLLMRGIK